MKLSRFKVLTEFGGNEIDKINHAISLMNQLRKAEPNTAVLIKERYEFDALIMRLSSCRFQRERFVSIWSAYTDIDGPKRWIHIL